MICRKCKTELPDTAVFCFLCGVKQDLSTRRKEESGWRLGLQAARHTARVTSHIGGRHSITKGGFIRKQDAEAYLPVLYQQLQSNEKA